MPARPRHGIELRVSECVAQCLGCHPGATQTKQRADETVKAKTVSRNHDSSIFSIWPKVADHHAKTLKTELYLAKCRIGILRWLKTVKRCSLLAERCRLRQAVIGQKLSFAGAILMSWVSLSFRIAGVAA
ncbi:hypothetical protein, partial [Pseudomonas syringae]|uniref:hypothetical protein n=1 Tax=Pseudomonas syringae TaxID=317 RepID=UPI001F1EABF2